MRIATKFLVAVLVIILVLAACGDGESGTSTVDDELEDTLTDVLEDEGVEVDDVRIEGDDERTITIESDEGTAVLNAPGGVPADFPWPIYGGTEVMNVSTIDVEEGRITTVALEVDLEQAEDVAAFYEAEFEAAGLETYTVRVGNESGGTIGVSGEGDEGAGSLSVIMNGDDTLATLSWAAPS